MHARTEALIHGALMALGASAVFDVLVVHGTLHWHTAVPGSSAPWVDMGLLAAGVVALGAALVREARARRLPHP